MRVISTGSRYELYDDALCTYDALPAQVYTVCFSKLTGFYLEKHADIEIDEKVYGVHTEKVSKVFKAFSAFERNLGVILSGNKGIGKSLFAKMLSIQAVQEGIPVILVPKFYPGIASYLESIEQVAMVLFDEFDKTFGKVKTSDNEADPQAGLLTLFDGMSQGKKLFVVTCNELNSLNDYLVNRPGRFHYHFRFEYPTAEEIQEYMRDKLLTYVESEVQQVIAFSRRVDLNYDCLRAIVFELNSGSTFKEAIQDLNILNTERHTYRALLVFKNGETRKSAPSGVELDLFGSEELEGFWMYNAKNDYDCHVDFRPSACVTDPLGMRMYIPGDAVQFYWDTDLMPDDPKWEVERLELSRVPGKNYRYTLSRG